VNLPERPAIRQAYETAVVALLNAHPNTTEEQAEAFVDAMAQLIFTTMHTYIQEEETNVSPYRN
jgi:hypothetical protein